MEGFDDLARIRALVDWSAFESVLEEVFGPVCGGPGRPLWDALVTFRSILLGVMHSLSDHRLQFMLLDRRTFKQFAGLHSDDQVPDQKTQWEYRERLNRSGRIVELLEQLLSPSTRGRPSGVGRQCLSLGVGAEGAAKARIQALYQPQGDACEGVEQSSERTEPGVFEGALPGGACVWVDGQRDAGASHALYRDDSSAGLDWVAQSVLQHEAAEFSTAVGGRGTIAPNGRK